MWSVIKDICLWIKNLFASHARIRSLEKENLELKQKISERDKQKLKFQEEITSLQEQVSKRTHIDSLLNGLIFDTTIGIYKNSSGIYLCKKCLHEKKEKIPLQVGKISYYCAVCKTTYWKPGEPRPKTYR